MSPLDRRRRVNKSTEEQGGSFQGFFFFFFDAACDRADELLMAARRFERNAAKCSGGKSVNTPRSDAGWMTVQPMKNTTDGGTTKNDKDVMYVSHFNVYSKAKLPLVISYPSFVMGFCVFKLGMSWPHISLPLRSK